MGNRYLPRTDQGILDWTANFSAKISVTAGNYGLTPEKVTAYEAKQTAYAAAMAVVGDPAQRTRVTIAAKNAARADLIAMTRLLVSIVEGDASLTDAQRIDLGLTVRKTPAPVPVPADAPRIDLLGMNGRALTIRLHDGGGTGRGKPADVNGASVFTAVGESAPANLSDWTFQFNTGRTEAVIPFEADLSPGTTVWVTACWFNPRKQPGPTALPQSSVIQYGPPVGMEVEEAGAETARRAA
jgi:hypothetical protein